MARSKKRFAPYLGEVTCRDESGTYVLLTARSDNAEFTGKVKDEDSLAHLEVGQHFQFDPCKGVSPLPEPTKGVRKKLEKIRRKLMIRLERIDQ